jgi:hypothetical protein
MGLQQFEERLERLVEGTLAKPFRSNLQPVEIGRRLTREMDLQRRVGVHGLIAPNAFVVTLAPADVDGASQKSGRFTVAAEVREGVDGGFLAEIVLGDGQRIQVGAEPLVIGRLPECGVVLPDSNVSRRHAQLRRVGDTVVLTDLGSTNGTRVNGAPIRERVLVSGDEVSVGSTKLVFEMT